MGKIRLKEPCTDCDQTDCLECEECEEWQVWKFFQDMVDSFESLEGKHVAYNLIKEIIVFQKEIIDTFGLQEDAEDTSGEGRL